MARSNVKGARRTARLIIFSMLIHTYNRASVDEKQKERATIAEKKKVKRVKGAERQAGLLPHLRSEISFAQQLKKDLPDGVYDAVYKHYRTGNKTKKAEAIEKKKEEMKTALAKQRNVTKNQRSAKPHIPVAIGGAIEFRWFAAKRKNEAPPSLLQAEIAHRGIEVDHEGERVTLQLDEEPLASMILSDMKDLLKRDELARMGRNDNVKEGAKLSDINSFKPLCEEMKEMIPAFVEWRTSKL